MTTQIASNISSSNISSSNSFRTKKNNKTFNYKNVLRYFKKKYEESLFAPYNTPSGAKFDISFLDNDYNNRNTDHSNNNNISKSIKQRANYYLNLLEDKGLDLKEEISTALNIKKSMEKVDDKITILHYHGKPILKLQRVPEDCIIVFLTPLSYLGICSNIHYETFAKFLLKSTTPKNFKENPFCLDKKYKNDTDFASYSKKLENYKVFFPNQLYYDINLKLDKDNNRSGSYTTTTPVNTHPKHNNITNTKGENLSKLIAVDNPKRLNGILFLTLCRDLDIGTQLLNNAKQKTLYEQARYAIVYEHMMNILNRSVWYYNNPELYDECEFFDEKSKVFISYSYSPKNSIIIPNFRLSKIKAKNQIIKNTSAISKNLVTLRHLNNQSLGEKFTDVIAKLGISTKLARYLFNNTNKLNKFINIPNLLLNLFEKLHNILFNSSEPYNQELFKRLLDLDSNIHLLIGLDYILNKKHREQYKTGFIGSADLLISFILFKIIKGDKAYLPFTIVLFNIIKKIKTISILLSFCNLTPAEINRLISILPIGQRHKLFINGNNLNISPKKQYLLSGLLPYYKSNIKDNFNTVKKQVNDTQIS